jgi:hypothetical protein
MTLRGIMAKLELKREYAKSKSNECYQAVLRVVPTAGYNIFKKRDIASLVICNGIIQGKPVELSLMVPLGGPTRVALTLSSELGDDELLNSEASRLFSLLDKELSH